MATWPILKQHPSLRKFLVWSGGGFIALVLFGFLALPPIVKHFAAKALGEKFHRTVTIRELSINPLKLSVRVGGFAMREGGDEPFLGFDQLDTSLGLASIREGAPVLHEIKVSAPYFRVVRKGDGSYSIDDIVAELLKPSDSPAQYSINNIHVNGGKFEFDDRPKRTRHLVSDLHLAIPFLSNLPYQAEIYVKPEFSAKVNGAPLSLTGKIKPFSKNRESSIDLDLTALDLARYFPYLPRQEIRLPSATLDANLEIAFAQPSGKPPAVSVSGKAAVKDVMLTDSSGAPLLRARRFSVDLQGLDVGQRKVMVSGFSLEQPEFHLPGGKLLVAAKGVKATGSSASWSGPAAVVSQQALEMHGLSLTASGEGKPRVEIATVALKDAIADLGKRSVTLAEFSSSGGRAAIRRDGKGVIDLLELLGAGKAAPATETRPMEQGPWQFALGKLSLDGFGASFKDELPQDTVNLDVEGISVAAADISNQKSQQAKLSLDLRFNKSATLALTGVAGLSPLAANLSLDLKGARLKPFQPYFTDMLTLIVTDGAVSAKGKLQVEEVSGGAPKVAFDGDIAINRFATIDKLLEEDFLKWNALNIRKIKAATQPLRLAVAEVELDSFFSRLIINSDGTLNLQGVLKKQGGTKVVSSAQPDGGDNSNKKQDTATNTSETSIDIAKVTLRNGNVDFSDYFIKPNYSAHLTGLGGSVTGLSSKADQLAAVALKGRVDDQGQLDINGKVNPLAGNLYLDLLANLQDFELSSLAPYSAKYAGYGIQKGKLSFDVKYHIENRKLSAENHLFLNQLTFGEKVESPVATKLPVLLAVALLKDRNGNIDVNLPISGSLDDPQFSVGGIVIKVIVNLVVKAVTAPFALIGSLFGGGEELAYLEFDYGRETLAKEAEGKLNTIAKALNDRPGLKLDIAGQVDPEKDVDALRQLQLERKVKAQKLKELLKNSDFSGSVDEVKLEQGEYARYLGAAYKQEKIPNKPRNFVGMAKDLPPSEMEKLILATIQVSEGDLQDLANHRSREAKEYLVNNGKIAPERIFLLAPQGAKNDQPKARLSRVNFVLGAR